MTELKIPEVGDCPACARAAASAGAGNIICNYHYHVASLQSLLGSEALVGYVPWAISRVLVEYKSCFGAEIRQEARRC